jgi:predicted enzyme related to lactoylglutathione lyase
LGVAAGQNRLGFLQQITQSELEIKTISNYIRVRVRRVSTAPDFNRKANDMEDQKNQTENSNLPVDNTPKVTGIGGIFFFADNPKETKEWYSKNLGFDVNEWGSVGFESRNLNKPEEINSLQWSPFKKGDDYFSPSKKDFMINYRVRNLEGLLIKLKENGVTILDNIATYDFGKFVHIMDTEGNKIELWEPAE